MPAVATTEQFLDTLRRSGLLEDKALDAYLETQRAAGPLPEAPQDLARAMLRDGLLTKFQADQVLQGKARGFVLGGKYKLLEHLGAGGMGTVYLCEHTTMRRRVAIKVLPVAKARDDSYLERFYREARAVAALDHPNIVRAHDIDKDEKLHFLVMEYIDGSSLQDLIAKHGPLDPVRAAHYMAQAALGLQHAHEAGLVHRDIKPGNILVDRNGTVKVLDMGLARFFNDESDNLSKKYDETVLGTSDYLAPEQTLGSDVDIRADIYSLGATFYFCLTGQTLFGEGTAAQKLIWHTTRQPKPICSVRPEVPEEMAEIIEKRMLAKDPGQRFQEPIEIFEALAPWTSTPIGPPPEDEMPKLSRAAAGPAGESGSGPVTPGGQGAAAISSRRSWNLAGMSSPRPAGGPATNRRSGGPASPPVNSPATRVAGRNGPVTTGPGSGTGSGVTGPGSGTRGERPSGKSGPRTTISDHAAAPTQVRRSGSKPRLTGGPGSGSRKRRRPQEPQLNPRVLAILGAAVVAPLVLAGFGLLLWYLFLQKPAYRPAHPGPAAQKPEAPRNPVPAPAPPPVVSIHVNPGFVEFKAPRYLAAIEHDGALTSLRVGGTELLRPAAGGVRGCYLARRGGEPVKLTSLEPRSSTAAHAEGNEAAIDYECGPDTITWAVRNKGGQPLSLIMVFGPAVQAFSNERGDWARVPADRDWGTAFAFAGPLRLKLTNGTDLRDDVEGRLQAWEAVLQPHETRRVTLQVGDASPTEQARVRQALFEHRVHKPGYEATVAGDGCLTSLRVGGTEFLWVGRKEARGAFFHQGNETLSLPDLHVTDPDHVRAQGDRAAVEYQFGPDGVTLNLQSLSDQPLDFRMVFGGAVTAVGNDRGEVRRTPTTQEWPTTVWYAGRSKLTVAGGTRVWGPWGEGDDRSHQVWDLHLEPHQTRTVTLKVGQVSDAEAGNLPR